MARGYGSPTDWFLCLCVAIMLLAEIFVDRFTARIDRLFGSLSLLRKAFGVLSLIAVPYMVSVGFGEQAASVMNPRAPIIWFIAAALNAIIFFWVCEELISTSPLLRILFLVTVGFLVILALRHQVNWAMRRAEKAAEESEIEEAHKSVSDAQARKIYYALLANKSSVTGHFETPSPQLRPQPLLSFPFVVPGIVTINGAWDFIVNHRGPDPSYNVKMLFIDLIRQKQLATSGGPLTGPDLDSFQMIRRFPEIDPKGHSSNFAIQFLWTPPIVDHEHYDIEITWRTGSVHEDLEIERVNTKWLWAMQIIDRDTKQTLVNCKDPGFPLGPPGNKSCFPEMVQPGT